MIVFPPSTDDDPQIVCIDVSINNDNVLEMEEELFLVVLESDDQRVSLTVENDRASVIITDNDAGMHAFYVVDILNQWFRCFFHRYNRWWF